MMVLRQVPRFVILGFSRAAVLLCLVGCESSAVDEEPGAGAGGKSTSEGSAGAPAAEPNACGAALRQSLGLVDEVTTAEVAVLDGEPGAEFELYVDASAGGVNGGDAAPWVYVSLATGERVDVTDLDALSKTSWDLGLKRFVLRSNGGDSGPGLGGSLAVRLPWESVTAETLGKRALPTEDWLDDDCNLSVDETDQLVTTFAGWSEYDVATHVLAPADVVFIVRGAKGTLYKLAVLDYYATATGGVGKVGARYKLRIAPLE